MSKAAVAFSVPLLILLARILEAQPAPVQELECRPSIPNVRLEWVFPLGTDSSAVIEVLSNEPGAVGRLATLSFPASSTVVPLPAVLPASIEYTVVLSDSTGTSVGQTCTLNTSIPGNDDCSNATLLGSGEVAAPWRSHFATTGGVAIPTSHTAICTTGATGEFYNDVWYEYTATFSDTLISCCGGLYGGYSASQIEMAIYDACPGDASLGQLIACDDDTCPQGQPEIEVTLTPGNTYLIRIGSSWENRYGAGELTIIEIDHPFDAFQRGDCNHDGTLNVADAIYFLNFIYPIHLPPPLPSCESACDANDDGSLNIADAVRILLSLFPTQPGAGGVDWSLPPPATCESADPTPDTLRCAGYIACP